MIHSVFRTRMTPLNSRVRVAVVEMLPLLIFKWMLRQCLPQCKRKGALNLQANVPRIHNANANDLLLNEK